MGITEMKPISLKQAERKTILQRPTRMRKIRFYSYWHFMKREFDHAGFVETSIMLAISDKVKMKKAKKGLITKGLSEKEIQRIKKLSTQNKVDFLRLQRTVCGVTQQNATKKDGEKFLAEIVRNLAKECQS